MNIHDGLVQRNSELLLSACQKNNFQMVKILVNQGCRLSCRKNITNAISECDSDFANGKVVGLLSK